MKNIRSDLWHIVLICAIEVVLCSVAAAQEPISISSIEELQKIGNDVAYPINGSYILTQDIDASATEDWNEGRGFYPIGNYIDYGSVVTFQGTFDGQSHIITNLTINHTYTQYVGLFGATEASATIMNVGMKNNSVTGRDYVGSLVGENGGTVSACYTTGAVTGGSYSGGLVGYNNGGTVSVCYTTGAVTGGDLVGGLVGYNESGTLLSCYATGTVIGQGYVGGLVGDNRGTLSECYTVGAVMGDNEYAYVGGLVGINSGTVSMCHATGVVTGSGDNIGGLIGYNSGTVSECYAIGEVTGKDYTGGLVGSSCGSGVSMCYATGKVTGTDHVGGLVGGNGGGMGVIVDAVSESYATGAVEGDEGVGGLVGTHFSGFVSECYATGTVTGNEDVGGLVGNIEFAKVSNCYARSDVAGADNIGALVGINWGVVSKCYATGVVTGEGNYVGGLFGGNGNVVSDSFWDREVNGLTAFAACTGSTTAKMMRKSTYTNAGWDFDTIWAINEGVSYPFLLAIPSDEGEKGLRPDGIKRRLGDWLLFGLSLTVLLSLGTRRKQT